MANDELMVTVPLYDYKKLCEQKGRIEALEELIDAEHYVSLNSLIGMLHLNVEFPVTEEKEDVPYDD